MGDTDNTQVNEDQNELNGDGQTPGADNQQTQDQQNTADQQTQDESAQNNSQANTELKLTEDLKAMGYDDEIVTEVNKIAAGMSEDQMKALLPLGERIQAKMEENAAKYWDDLDAQWLADLQKDPEVGGDKLEANSIKVNNLLKKFDTDGEFTKFITDMNMRNCKPIFKLMHRIAGQFTEDQLVTDNAAHTGEKPPVHMRMGWKGVDEY